MEAPTPLDRAISAVGTQQALADLLGIRSPSITEWKTRGVPAERCRAIEAATGRQVTVHDLRPDVFGPGDQDQAPPAPAGPVRLDTPEAVARALGVARQPLEPAPAAAPDPEEPEVPGDSRVVPFESPP